MDLQIGKGSLLTIKLLPMPFVNPIWRVSETSKVNVGTVTFAPR